MDGPGSYLHLEAELPVRGISAARVCDGEMGEGIGFSVVLRDTSLRQTWEGILDGAEEGIEPGSYPYAKAEFVRVHCRGGRTGLFLCRNGPR